MTAATLSATIQERIQNICDVNSSWAQNLSEAGVLDLLDMEMEFENSGFSEVLAEDYDISDGEAAQELNEFVRTNRAWDAEALVRYMPFAIEHLQEFGYDPEQTVDAIYDYYIREEAEEVLTALTKYMVETDDIDELFDAYVVRLGS